MPRGNEGDEMDEMTVPDPGPAGAARQVLTWRDALTPLSRTSRRRWAVIYGLLLTAGGAISIWPEALGLSDDQRQRTSWLLVIALLVVFGMLRRGTRRLTALDHPSLDERDLAARDRAFRLAYPLLMVVVLVTFVVMVIDATEIRRLVEATPESRSYKTASYVDIVVIRDVLVWVALWWIYLPTGILAWREPDAIGIGGDGSPGVAEPARDALLVLALGTSALGVFASTAPWSLLPLLVVPGVLGVLARRKVGQPPVVVAPWKLGATGIWLSLVAVCVLAFAEKGPATVAWAIGAIAAGLVLVVIAVRRR